jgi:oligopeptide/dipeptide ABC transporter ATP-binding protein
VKKTIELKNISKIYKKRNFFKKSSMAHILKNVSFFIEEGKTLGLVGESGSGKTTTARMILRQEAPTGGEILYYGKSIQAFSKEEKAEYRRSVQMVFQDPYSSLDPEMKIRDIIEEPLKISKKHKKGEMRQRAMEMVKQVGLEEDCLDRHPKEFSGGQRQRIAIARALIGKPALVIFDEPVSALDVSVRGQILNLLKQIQEQSNAAYLYISHDMASVGFLSDSIAVMYFGYIVEYGSADDVLENCCHPYAEMLIHLNQTADLDDFTDASDLIEAPSHAHPPLGCPYSSRCNIAADICYEKIPALREISPSHFAACHRIHA